MNKPVKLPEIRKEAFTKARENLGLSTKDLSGMACLSVRQIEQIENGESNSFYGAQVKVTAAKKVAGLLKMSEAEAFDFGEVAPAKKEDAKKADQEVKQETPSVSASAEKKSTPAKAAEKKVAPATTASSNTPIEMNSMKQGVNQESGKSKKKLFLLVSVAAALVFSIVNLRPLFFSEAPKEEPVATQDTPAAPAESPDPKAAVPTPEAIAPAPVAPPATAPAPPTTVATAAVSAECPAVDAAAMNYKPDTPKKAGDMVYLQSKTAQTVCVVDASGKTQNKTLEPGVGASIYGKPPLKVMTSGLNQVDVYYQGSKVRLGNTSAKTLILEQAEIIQPLAPTDSQLR